MRILALDQGTTSTRLFAAEAGRFLPVGQLRHETRYPAPDKVEQDAAELLRNCRALLDAAGAADAIGLANQGESCLAWDARTGEPLSPVIVWQDRRTLAVLAGMEREGLAPEVTTRSGLPLDPYFSAAKLGWLVATLPAVREALKKGRLRLGTTDAFLLDRLAGCFATDRATASRTGLMNLASGEWDAALCGMFGVPMAALPPILPNLADFGRVDGVPVTASIVDQQAALWGHGCREPGEAKITFGTGAFLLAVSGPVPPDPARLGGLLPTVAWDLGPGIVYAIDGGVQDAGSAVEWAIRAGLADGVADFDGFAAAPAIDRGLVFVPAFSGLGAPDWDRSAAPAILGLAPEMTRRDICQALLESVALQTAALAGAAATAVPLADTIAIDGGLSGSGYFAAFLAQATGRGIVVPAEAERTALGTASLAALGAGGMLQLDEPAPRRIAPAPCPDAWKHRHAAAIARSRGWRGIA